MAIKTGRFDAAELLRTSEEVAAYLDAWLEDGTAEEIRMALSTIARSNGMTALSKKTGITREALYKALGENGNPTLDTLLKVTDALDLQLTIRGRRPEDMNNVFPIRPDLFEFVELAA